MTPLFSTHSLHANVKFFSEEYDRLYVHEVIRVMCHFEWYAEQIWRGQ